MPGGRRRLIVRVPERVVTLSFDNGPEKGVTPFVLDVLKDRQATANFFVVGDRLRRTEGRAASDRALEEGHRIGGHTMTHSVPIGLLDEAEARHEITGTDELMGDLRHPEHLWRPYGKGGVTDDSIVGPNGARMLAEGGYTCVLWTSVPIDGIEPDARVERALADIESTSWSVVVLHDLPTGAMDHLPRFFDELDHRGIEVRADTPTRAHRCVAGCPRYQSGAALLEGRGLASVASSAADPNTPTARNRPQRDETRQPHCHYARRSWHRPGGSHVANPSRLRSLPLGTGHNRRSTTQTLPTERKRHTAFGPESLSGTTETPSLQRSRTRKKTGFSPD